MNFQQAISSYKRTWVIGKCLKTLLVIASILVATIILYGLADSIWSLSNSARSILNLGIIGTGCLAAIYVVYRAVKTSYAELSSTADVASTNQSKTIRAAYDLSQQESPSPLHEYLSQEAQEKAVKDINNISLKKKIPFKNIGMTALGLFTLIGAGYGIRSFHPAAYDTVTQRLIHPDKDIPPYSPLKFAITQESPRTVYGGANQVRVKITGAELEQDVVCYIRDKQTGKTSTVNTFQESHNVFSKKFTNILGDIEFSFATGKARSHWQTIQVLLQPKFTTALIKVTPPSYTKMSAQESPLEGNEITVINGSNISLSITSNRPLSGGEIIIKAESESGLKENLVKGTTSNANPNEVTFSWVAGSSSSISCIIKDIRDTNSAAPLEFSVVTRADLAPVAELTSPASFVLATPNSHIPLKGIVEDDYEIDSVYLVRTLVGFRDRAKQLSKTVSKDQYDFGQTLDLEKLGVEKDQILEFYIEANDKNPSLLGIGTSDVVRVKIISEEDYAESLRNASDLKQFNIRYKILSQAIRNAVKSLKELSVANQGNDIKDFNLNLEKSKAVHLDSHEMALKIGTDFKAFELESQLTETAMEIAEKLVTNQAQLTELNFDSDAGSNDDKIEEMLNRLGGTLEKAKKLERNAEDIQEWANVAEQASIFKKLLNNQLSISSRITNIAKELQVGVKRNAKRLKSLGSTQQKNKEKLLTFAQDLKKSAADLPLAHVKLQEDVDVWLKAFNELNIPNPMDAATLSTQVGKSHEAADHSSLAYSLMKQLVDMEKNLFAELLRNDISKTRSNEELHKTMKELLNALHKRNAPQGEGDNGQQNNKQQADRNKLKGFENGDARGGGMMRNQNTPMFGPDRTRFTDLGSGNGNNGTAGGLSKHKPKISSNNSVQSTQKRNTETSQATRTNVPSKYKDAVKRFYTESDKDKQNQ